MSSPGHPGYLDHSGPAPEGDHGSRDPSDSPRSPGYEALQADSIESDRSSPHPLSDSLELDRRDQ